MSDDLLGLDEFPVGLDDELNVIERADVLRIADLRERRNRVEQTLRAHMYAYRRVFRDGNATEDDRRIVLDDLANFCRKSRTTFHADPRLHAALEGRREVVLRIDEFLELTLEQLVTLKVPHLAEGSS